MAMNHEYESDTNNSWPNNSNNGANENSNENALLDSIDASSTHGVSAALKAGADPKKMYGKYGDYRYTVLHFATKQTEINPTILKLLLEAKADPNVRDSENMLPLNYAVESNNDDAIAILLEKTNLRSLKISPIPTAAANGNLELVEYLVHNFETIKDTDKHGYTAVMAAAANGHVDIIDYLLQKSIKTAYGFITGADVNDQHATSGETALMLAAEHDHEKVVEYLLQYAGADPNIQSIAGDTALMLAIVNRSDASIGVLIENKSTKINIQNKKGETALMLAVHNRDIQLSKFLITHGADINIPNKKRIAAFEQLLLEMATQTTIDDASIEMAEFLLQAGADTSSAFKIAVNAINTDLIEFLLLIGLTISDKDIFDIFRNPSLTEKVAKIIIEKYGDVDMHDGTGRTLISHVAEVGSVAIVRLLLERGADPTFADGVYGRTPLYYALTKGRRDVARVISDALTVADVSIDDLTIQTARDILLIATDEMAPLRTIAKFILDQVKTMWKGWEESDSVYFDAVLDTTPGAITARGQERSGAENTSFCPICLAKTSRGSGCMYMHHNCAAAGGYYNRDLYNKYKNPTGDVFWCTLCGRPALGHRHFNLLDTSATPKHVDDLYIITPGTHVNPFGGFDDCKLQGGGGHEEKVTRFYAVVQKALELQSRIGTMFHEDAMDELVKAAFNAPSVPATMDAAKAVIAAGKWHIDHTKAFAEISATATVPDFERRDCLYPFSHLPILMPVIDEALGDNLVATEFDVPICRFHHSVGYDAEKKLIVNKHSGEEDGIGVAGLLTTLKLASTDPSFGYCWKYSMGEGLGGSCKARLYPEEVRPLLIRDPKRPDLYMMDKYSESATANTTLKVPTKEELSEILKRYTREFNNKFGMIKRVAAGGAGATATMHGGGIFQSTPVREAVSACPPPRKGGRRKTYKKINKRRNSRRRHTYRRRRA